MTTLKASEGAQFARILSVGSALPSRVVPNADLLEHLDSSDEWITQRTGIRERRWIAEDESIETLSLTAAESAIERAGIDRSEIGAVILATISHYHQTPALAPQLATALGIPDAAAYDISAACAGFCYGLAQAESIVRSGQAKYVLLIAGETISEITDLTDRGTAFLFGDGAGAVIVGPSETNGIGPVVWGSDGSQAGAIWQTAGWHSAVETGTWPKLGMDGRAVFKWATSFIAQATKKCLDGAGVSADELEVFIPHQANDRITDTLLRYLKLPESVVVARTIRSLGNNSAATIPMAMDALLASGEARSGQTALVIGFGAGLVYAGQVITLP
ncbi:MAG TPA: beta-ketoacyl-ACP synthase III [Propionicimonas sp.]|jgi:3-oxoacyl-[acyl-carrier-protein] synthase-3|nr:beta-ketoacyl-ACP synthase III [Propionicimonas sp.]